MRLAGKEKGGHYPTPPMSQAQIVRHLRYPADRPVRLLDPCAGKGAAILAAARVNPLAANVEILAVENSPRYDHPCRSALEDSGHPHRFLLCAWEEVSMTVESVGLLWLNPPYDFEALQAPDEEQEGRAITHRVEYTFLKSATPKLQPNGVLVYIVPLTVIQRPAVLRYLTSHYASFQVRSFPDPEYDDFDQVVLFARNKGSAEHDPDAYKLLAERVKARPPALSMADDFTYEIPVRPEKLTFRKNQLTYAESVALVARHGAQHDPKWLEGTTVQRLAAFQPAAPPNLGHLATFIVSGLFDTINLGDRVIRGAATKRVTAYDQLGNVVDNPDAERVTELRESFDTVIYALDRKGHYKVIRKPEELQALLAEHIDLLHLLMMEQFKPLYNGDPTEDEWRSLDSLMPHKRLPGRTQAGLLLAQKHAVVTMMRVLEAFGCGWLVADMGSGKGPMGYSIADALDAYPLLVTTPAHLVEKHKREAVDTIGAGDPLKVVIAEQASDILAAYQEYAPGQKLIVIVGIPAASLGPGVHRVRVRRKVITPKLDPDTRRQIGWKAVEREVCPHCGQPLDPKLERSSKQIVKCSNKACRAPLYSYGNTPGKYLQKRAKNPRWSFAAWAGYHSPETRIEYEGKRPVRVYPEQRAPIKLEDYVPLPTGMTMHKWPLARVIAERIPKGFFRLYIADEAHQFKAKGTDRGYAFQLLVNASRMVLGTTGTLFGGYARDLFYLMYRSMPSFRQKFGFHETGRFIDQYGRRAYFYNKPKEEDDPDYGKTTGNKRYIVRDKDLPGISPMIYPELLPYTLFLRISDLGYALPAYEERMPTVVMTELLALQYTWLYDTLYDVIYEGMTGTGSATMHDAMQLLSTWFMNTLRRPMSAFRSEVVMRAVGYQDADEGIDTRTRMPFLVKPGTSERFGLTAAADRQRLVELDLDPSELEAGNPATGQDERAKPPLAVDFDARADKAEAMVLYPAVEIDGLLPKEEWLVRTIKELAQEDGRKVLLYLEQTGKRDIQPRLERILAKAGLRSATVPSGDARSREEWIRKHAQDVHVLITNPAKVREGLDLVQFSALIFYELPTSLFTLMQAMKRVWRLGQTRDVLVLVPYHVGVDNSMEYHVLKLMAQKVRAAALLYGENASSAFADQATDADTAADLAKAIIKQAAQKLDMTDGIGSLLGDLVAQEMAASRAAQAEAEAAGEEAAGIGVYEEDDPAAEDAFYTDAEEEEEEEGEAAEPAVDVFSLFDLPADIFAPLEEPMRKQAAPPDALVDPVDLTATGADFTIQPPARTPDPTVTADPMFPETRSVLYPPVATPGLPRPVVDGKVETRSERWIPRPPHLYADSDTTGGKKLKQYDAWLVEQASAEAAARSDTFNGEQFAQIDARHVHPAGRGELHTYLFGEEYPLFRDPEPSTKLAAPSAAARPTLTVAEVAELLRPVAGAFYNDDDTRRHQSADMHACAASAAGGFWRSCKRTLAGYTCTDALLANAIRRLAGELGPDKEWQPAVGDQVLINKTTRGSIKRVQGDEYHIEVMTASGGKGIRKASRFQIELATSAEAPAGESAETERTMTGREVAQLLQSGRDAVLPDNIIPAAPVPPAAPEKVWPGRKFQWEGITYRFPDHLQMIGQPYDAGTLNTQEVAEGKDPEALSQRSWGSLADFIRTTGFQVIADERYTADDFLKLRELIAGGTKILIADSGLGLPTIHQMRNPQHLGLGCFKCVTPEYTVLWDAGGAMRSTRPSVNGERSWEGISYTDVLVKEGDFPYDAEQALAAIDWWLAMPQPEPAPAMKLVEVSVPVEPVDFPPAPNEKEPDSAAETPAEPQPELESDDFFAGWNMASAFDANTGVSVLAMKPKKANARKAARSVGRTDAFKKMMASEPEFTK